MIDAAQVAADPKQWPGVRNVCVVFVSHDGAATRSGTLHSARPSRSVQFLQNPTPEMGGYRDLRLARAPEAGLGVIDLIDDHRPIAQHFALYRCRPFRLETSSPVTLNFGNAEPVVVNHIAGPTE